MLMPPLMSTALARQRQQDYRRETTRHRRAPDGCARRRSAGRASSIVRAALLGAGLLALASTVGYAAPAPDPLPVSASCPWVQGLTDAGGQPQRLLFKLCAIERGGATHVTVLGARASSVSRAQGASCAAARRRQD
jgi:hypothetical protein